MNDINESGAAGGSSAEGPGTVALAVTGMHCSGCVETVERVVKREDAGARVSISLETGAVDIVSDAPAAGFIAAIEGAGYDARSRAPGEVLSAQAVDDHGNDEGRDHDHDHDHGGAHDHPGHDDGHAHDHDHAHQHDHDHHGHGHDHGERGRSEGRPRSLFGWLTGGKGGR
jgi:copper chaperone CopZ